MEEKNKREEVYREPEYYVKQTIKKVKAILKEHFPRHLSFGDGTFTITRGSTQVMITVKHLVKNETVVNCFSNVVRNAQLTPKLMHFLLRKNAELQFGAFSLLFDGTIVYSHSLTGSNLDPNELIISLSSVAFIADYYDDVIVEMAGGQRASDYLKSLKST